MNDGWPIFQRSASGALTGTDVLGNEVAILILAAGASKRMRGTDKLLEKVDNRPILRRTATIAVETGCPVYVALPANNQPRLATLAGLPLTQLEVEDADVGMSASLGAGVKILPPTTKAVMVVLADMPDLTGRDLKQMIQRHHTMPRQILRAVDQSGRPGHPVVFPAHMFYKISRISGDEGARGILKNADVEAVVLPDNHATTDLDTPEQWLAWRKANPFRN